LWLASLGTAGLLLVGSLWALFGDRPRGRKRCPRCAYSFEGVEADQLPCPCPECGRGVNGMSELQRTRRRPWLAGLLLLGAGLLAWPVPTATKHGWLAIVPTPVVDAAIGAFLQDAAEFEF